MPRFVADIGNTRVKWSEIDSSGLLVSPRSWPAESEATWRDALAETLDATPGAAWAVSSVHPRHCRVFEDLFSGRTGLSARLFRSAADVPVRHALATPLTTGADRALAVLAAVAKCGEDRPGNVVSCGTAITVERVAAGGLWEGGAITAGLRMTALALHQFTAQLPRIEPSDSPPPWGDSTLPALEAGVFWGTVGAAREILARQGGDRPWRLWTGGDALRIGPLVDGPEARIVPDLVLEGLALAAFGEGA